jgi:peptidyl-prolyl cis-trans isomerase SurA
VLRTPIIAAAGAAALALLTACGGTVQMGSAAIVGSNGISAVTLNNEVANLNAAYQAAHGRVRYQFPPGRAPQQVLSWLLRFRVRDQLATRRHISVTTAESQHALAAARSQAAQSRASLTDLAVANGLPPDLLPALGRYQAIESKLVYQLDGGALPSSQAGLQTLSRQFDQVQCQAAKSLSIRVNPQYGQLNYTQLAVMPAVSTLSAPAGVPASQSTPAAPAC